MQKTMIAVLALTLAAGVVSAQAPKAGDEVKQLSKEQLGALKPEVELADNGGVIKIQSTFSAAPGGENGKAKFRIITDVLRTKKAASGRQMVAPIRAGTASFYLLDANQKVVASKTVPLEQFCAT